MKKPNSDNSSKPKSKENAEKSQKEVQKESNKGDIKDESNIPITLNSTSQDKEDNLDSYPNEYSNSNLLNEVESFCANKGKEEPKACEITEIKNQIKIEPLKIDSQQDKKKIIPRKLFLKKKRKKENENPTNIIEKIIKKNTDFLLQKKKQYKKNHFDEILKVNNLEGFSEKIEIAIKEEESEYKDKIYYEEDENLINNDSPDKSFKKDYSSCIDINEAVNSTSDIFHVGSTLVKSLYNNKNIHGISSTKTLSTTNDE